MPPKSRVRWRTNLSFWSPPLMIPCVNYKLFLICSNVMLSARPSLTSRYNITISIPPSLVLSFWWRYFFPEYLPSHCIIQDCVFICLVRLLRLEWKHHRRQGPESVRCCVLGAQTAPLIQSYSKWWIGTVEHRELLSFRSVWSCEKMHVLSAFTQSCLSCWGQVKGCLFPKDNRDPGFLWSFKKGLI